MAAPSTRIGPPPGNAAPLRPPNEPPQQRQQRPSEMTLLQAKVEEARARFEAFTAGPVAAMRRDMAQRTARQSLCRTEAVDATQSSAPSIRTSSSLSLIEEEKTALSSWQVVPRAVSSQSFTQAIGGVDELGLVDERKLGAMSSSSSVLHEDEIADLKRLHESSLSLNTRKAYQSDYDSWVEFLRDRFPRLPIDEMEAHCTLEHVLAYLRHLCNDQKKISTINRRLSSLRKHILPRLFHRAAVPGSREEQALREVAKIVTGIRRTVGAEQRVRGKKPLMIEEVREMVNVANKATNDDGEAMPNKRCRDVSLLLFLFHSAMRRNEIAKLLWSDLSFDKRGVVVQIRKSNTDVECKGQTIAIPRLDGPYCAVAALERWRDKSGGTGDSPVFRWISKKDEIQFRELIDQRIVALIKYYCEQVGLDEKLYSGHSGRAGYVSSCSDRGVSISEIMKRMRHKAPGSVAVYARSDELFRHAGDAKL